MAGSATKSIFYAYSPDGQRFSPRVRLDDPSATSASHPQIALRPDGRALVVWDDLSNRTRRVVMRRVASQQTGDLIVLSGGSSAYYPVAAVVGPRELVAWTQAASGSDSRIRVVSSDR